MFAGIISGGVYQQMSDKVVMARKLVAEKGLQLSDQLSNNAYFEEVARQFQLSGQELTHYSGRNAILPGYGWLYWQWVLFKPISLDIR